MSAAKKPKAKRKPAVSKGGRPPVADPRRTVSLRLNAEERDLLKKRALAHGIPETIFARIAVRRALGLDVALVPLQGG